MKNSELYFSIDIESDGPIPGRNSMLSLGCAAFSLDSDHPIEIFSMNFELLPEATQNESTMEFWKKNQAAYDETRHSMYEPENGMPMFIDWVLSLCEKHTAKPVAVGYPVTFDFMFMHWYLMAFVGSSPFGFQGLDCKTLGMALLGDGFRNSTKKNYPRRWFGKAPHNHIAVDDAIEQGVMFVRMMKELKGDSSSS